MTAVERPEDAVAVGGPLDGTVLGSASADRFEVRMADGSTHRYVRSGEAAAGGRTPGRAYDYAGRT